MLVLRHHSFNGISNSLLLSISLKFEESIEVMSVDDGIDEWDENFLDEAIRVELEAISSSNFPVPSRNPITPFPSVPNQPSSSFIFDGGGGVLSFSPPRELSQRVVQKPELSFLAEDCAIIEQWNSRNVDGNSGHWGCSSGDRKDKDAKEVERLKRELGCLSKTLNQMEYECADLRKDRLKKDEQLKVAFSQIKIKDAEIRRLSRVDLETGSSNDQPNHMHECKRRKVISESDDEKMKAKSYGKSKIPNEPRGEDLQTGGTFALSELKQRTLIGKTGSSLQESCHEKMVQLKSCKTIGIQTDSVQDCIHSTLQNVRYTGGNIFRKLFAVWGLQDHEMSGRNLVPKLPITCSSEFSMLLRCMSTISQTKLDSQVDNASSDVALTTGLHSLQSTDFAKISNFCEVLVKMHRGMLHMDGLVKGLLNICTLENVLLLQSCLCVLHQLCCSVSYSGRNNILLVQCSADSLPEKRTPHKLGVTYNGTGTSRFSEDFDSPYLCNINHGSSSIRMLHSFDGWFSLFEMMRKIVARNLEENVQIEALSIMNLILMRSDPNSERDKFDLVVVLECVTQLLQKNAGSLVKLQVVRLLFLILNCPKTLTAFILGQKDDVEHSETNNQQQDSSSLKGAICGVLTGLAESLAEAGSGAQELKVRKNIIILLAFIASSGKAGFEVLCSAIPKGTSFLDLIIQVLASEMDSKIVDSAKLQELRKERNSLMREALILLNRLASHPTYSKFVLGALTNGNKIASATIDVANKLSRENRRPECLKTTHIDVEIVDLARLFRARIFAFLAKKQP